MRQNRISQSVAGVTANQPPAFTDDMDNQVLSESTPVGTVVYQLKGSDPEGSPVHYGIVGTDRLQVDRATGQVKLVQPLDREVRAMFSSQVITQQCDRFT